jgi:hypothetical protein
MSQCRHTSTKPHIAFEQKGRCMRFENPNKRTVTEVVVDG